MDKHIEIPAGMEERVARITEKMQPQNIRSNLAFAGLYSITYEMIKNEVLKRVKVFYGCNPLSEKDDWLYGEAAQNRYSKEVLELVRGKRFEASLQWLINNEAISEEEADKLSEIKAHRDELAHKLLNYLISDEFEPDIKLFHDAVEILEKISYFWTNIEVDTGIFGNPDEIRAGGGATPGTLIALRFLITAYGEGNTKIN